MIKTTAFIGLSLCVLLLSGCAPKIDGSSATAYEDSLVKVASGLDNEKREVFKVAADIVISRSPSLPNLDEVANARAAISGKSANDVINEATDLAKKEYIEVQKAISEYEASSSKNAVQHKSDKALLDSVMFKINKIVQSTKTERYEIESGSEEYYRLGDARFDPLSRWRTRVSAKEFIATVTITNNGDVDIDSVDIYLKGVNPNGKTIWDGYVRYVSTMGKIKSKQVRNVTLNLLTDVTEYFDDSNFTNWINEKNKPTLDGLVLEYVVSTLKSGGKTIKWNDPEPSAGSVPKLPEDIDHFLTLIKYKR